MKNTKAVIYSDYSLRLLLVFYSPCLMRFESEAV